MTYSSEEISYLVTRTSTKLANKLAMKSPLGPTMPFKKNNDNKGPYPPQSQLTKPLTNPEILFAEKKFLRI